jgi:hypothetical protein
MSQLVLVTIVFSSVSTILFSSTSGSVQPVSAASSNSNMSGPGEAWTLTFYGSKPASYATLQNEWDAYYAKSDFQAYKAEFGWNLIRLSFCFVNICGQGPYSLDPNNSTQMSWFDWVVSAANSNGLKVMPSEFSFTGSGPNSTTEMSAFIGDWEALAQHEKGNPGIAMYQIANEIKDNSVVNSVYGNLDNFLGNITNGIRSHEPGRIVAWIAGPPYSDGISDVYQDSHISTYTYNSSREFDGCMSTYDLGYWPSLFAKSYSTYGVPAINGEINSEEVTGEPLVNGYPECDTQAVLWVQQMIAYQIPYVLWGYNEYRSNWDHILSLVASSTTTTSTTTTITSTVSITSTSSMSTYSTSITTSRTSTSSTTIELVTSTSVTATTTSTSTLSTASTNAALSQLLPPVVSLSSKAVDSNQSVSVFATTPLSGGTPPYTCQWLENSGSGYNDIGPSFSCEAGSLPYLSTALSTGSYSFELQIVDDSPPDQAVTSNVVETTVNPSLVAPMLSPFNQTVNQGLVATIVAPTPTTGTPAYNYKWLEEAPNASSYSPSTNCSNPTPLTCLFATNNGVMTGPYSFELQVEDGASAIVVSSSVEVTVSAPLPTYSHLQSDTLGYSENQTASSTMAQIYYVGINQSRGSSSPSQISGQSGRQSLFIAYITYPDVLGLVCLVSVSSIALTLKKLRR